jgi:hypothetical protein
MVKRLLGTLGILVLAAAGWAVPTAAAPGTHSVADVNASIEAGIAYLDTQQNLDGSFGSSGFYVSETSFALIAYGVSDKGDFNNLSPARKVIVGKAVDFILAQQDATTGDPTSGRWLDGTYSTYPTGLALVALSFSDNANAGIPDSIARGRAFLIGSFQGPGHNPPMVCSTDPVDPTSQYCGGFSYENDEGSADASNTGFGMTGLALSGGLPADIVTYNTGWQRNVQEITSNTYASANDGGGDYGPGVDSPGCCPRSNALSTGSMLFGFGYDGVASTDPGVVAGLKFGQDILDVYELTTSIRRAVYHTGATEDGACDPAVGGCTWTFENTSEGGYHYSMWALSKGLGEYLAPDLADAGNWYAKVADLLLTDQAPNGSWPVDGRDDASPVISTSFSIFALGLAATPPAPVTSFTASAGAACNAVNLSWTNPSTSNYGGVEVRRRSDAYPTSETDGTEAANVPAPATGFTDTAVSNGQTYYYSAFSYDTTGQLFSAAATASATPACPPGLPAAGAGGRQDPPPAGWLAVMTSALGLAALASRTMLRRRDS